MGTAKNAMFERTESEQFFNDWMAKNHWDFAVEICPVERGEYLFATDAYDIWTDFVVDHPEYEHDEDLRDYVYEHGPYGTLHEPEERDV